MQLRRVDRLVLAGDAAGDHHLDQVGAERDLPAGARAELGGTVALERVAVAVAVAAGAHQRLAGGEDPRAGRPPGIDRRAQGEVGTVALGHAAHRRDAGLQRAAGAVGHVQRQLVGRHPVERRSERAGQRRARGACAS